MTPTLAASVAAIEQALSMGPTPGEWMYLGTDPWNGASGQFAQWRNFTVSANSLDKNEADFYFVASVSNANDTTQNEANAALIAACSPDVMRLILAELAALRKDADRYRWLRTRDVTFETNDRPMFVAFIPELNHDGSRLDFCIDAAQGAQV